MDPISLILMSAQMGGGMMESLDKSQKKIKSIDPQWLKQHFGAKAVTDEMMSLFNNILNSSYGQQLMTNAAEQGQQFQTDMARKAAASGFGPTGGATSGASIFSEAAAGGATNALQRDAKAGIMQGALTSAQQMVRDRMQIASQSEMERLALENAKPGKWATLGSMLTRGAGGALAAGGGGGQTAGAQTPQLPTSQFEAPRGVEPDTMNSIFQMATPGTPTTFTKRRSFPSRLGGYLQGGMSRLATSGGTQ